MHLNKAFLVAIVSLGFLLRMPLISTYPYGFTPDEASFGYDAYSLIKTGKDQWGHVLPLVLESFGDFKMPLYSYLSIPSIFVLGLSKFSVRLPNAILGTLAIYVTYLMVFELLKFFPKKHSNIQADFVSIFSAFFLAISPWHVQMSRGAFESNLTTFLLPLGVFMFLKSLANNKYLIFSAVIFGLNLFSYHSARLFTPLLAFALVILFKKEMLEVKKVYKFLSVFILLIFLSAALYTYKLGAGRRAQDLSILAGALEAQSENRLKALNSGVSPVMARLLNNKYLVIADRFSNNYFSYFSPKFLFVQGAGETTYGMIPGRGVLYWLDFPLLMLFVIFTIKYLKNKVVWVLILWILLAPVPASFAAGVGYAANRSVITLPAIPVATAIGLAYSITLIRKFAKYSFTKYFTPVVICTYLVLLTGFVHYYLSNFGVLSKGMLYGNLEAASWLKINTTGQDNIQISRRLSEPHIYIAFANKWDPTDYQLQTMDWQRYKRDNLKFLDQLGEYSLGNYKFKNIEFDNAETASESLVVGKLEELLDTSKLLKTFYYPDGALAVFISKNSEEIYAKK